MINRSFVLCTKNRGTLVAKIIEIYLLKVIPDDGSGKGCKISIIQKRVNLFKVLRTFIEAALGGNIS